MRVINSPGLQITETDLSLNQQIGAGTNVYVAGFAPQGPTDEVNLVTTVSELEQIYGVPQTAAERYFYHTCKELINSPARLLTTRLPYGADTGDAFANTYSALLYPVSKETNTYKIGKPKHINLDVAEYNNIVQNNITWESTGYTSSTTVTPTAFQERTFNLPTSTVPFAADIISKSLANALLSASYVGVDPGALDRKTVAVAITALLPSNIIYPVNNIIDSTPFTYVVENLSPLNSRFTFQIATTSTPQVITEGTADYDPIENKMYAGIVVINQRQTTVNEAFEGYYINIADNSEFGADSNFTAVTQFLSLTGGNKFAEVTKDRLTFALSAEFLQSGSGSISETIESIPTFKFNDPSYNDSVVVSVFKVRNSVYEPQLLAASLVESHIGSLNKERDQAADLGGISRTFFLQDIINENSNNLKLFVNPSIAKDNWILGNSVAPASAVRVNQDNKVLYPYGVFNPIFNRDVNKVIGNVQSKLERALSLVDSTETTQVDVVVDAGLSTIHSNVQLNGIYDDEKFFSVTNIDDPQNQIVLKWKSIYSTFNTFAKDTRKDCMFIADPLRQIFVNGENTKTLSIRGNTFSTNVYRPLKTLVETANSNYSATYGNWAKVYDVYYDKQIWVPFSGFAAATIARTDAVAYPWIAPAGLNRGIVGSILDLAINPNQKQRDFLYTISINPVVFFSGDGFVVFGQKTLQNKPSAFDRINVRRLFLTLEKAVSNVLKYYVFEPNTDFTRTRLKNDISPVFDLAKNTQGLYDFLIVCDERNNTPDVIDRNELAVDIYIKPVRAAEFILVNFIATRTGQNFQELI